ncbi:MAG: 50S ribosomal protein L11 methyltransferase [Verrucomicrobia bacterium]|nr:50S ribosomal protein L11 methyltransferase [Verrucomicrobiota bacterium]
MKEAKLWQISVTTSAEAEEALAALLEREFKQKASIYVAHDSVQPTVTVYASKLPGSALSAKAALALELNQLARFGLETSPGVISIKRVAREDWTRSWKKYFKVLEVGRALLIKPSWSKRRPRKGEALVVLDPGLSFGTGQHPTTAFCLRQLVACRKNGQRQSFLDIGTGSGILAIAAARLGYAPVKAFDADPVAVRVANANAKRNRVADGVRIARADLRKLSCRGSAQFDLICANLLSDVLVRESERIFNRLRVCGHLVAAGILASEFPQVRKAYEAIGLRLLVSEVEGGWKSGTFTKPAPDRHPG